MVAGVEEALNMNYSDDLVYDDTNSISIRWHIKDIQRFRSDLSDKQALLVLKWAAHLLARSGITWDDLDYCADVMFPGGNWVDRGDERNWHLVFDDTSSISLRWHICDVQYMRPDLDDAQAFEVLETVKWKADCTIGVSLEVIEFWADELYPQPEFNHPE